MPGDEKGCHIGTIGPQDPGLCRDVDLNHFFGEKKLKKVVSLDVLLNWCVTQ